MMYFSRVQLLFHHGLCVVVLHLEVLQVDVDAFHIYFHSHTVVIEGLSDISQLF